MKITYRPEIDGLRAIAVFSVILYHANFIILNKSLFSGGFLGVDIFFVISGYLITSIILKEIYLTNNFSFINFYERRARRIFPALLFVILFSLPFAYSILLIEPFIDFSKSIISSLFFISNIYFNFTDNLYGQEHTLYKPFLHTWSLSVEEQFYIFFPIFLIIIIKFFKKNLIFFLGIGFLISILFSQYSSIYHSGINFYQIFSRGFELLLGSILSYLELNNIGWDRKYKRKLNQLFPKLGISMIIFSIFYFNDRDLLPSFYSLIPLSGVCLIICFSHKDEIITKILSNKKFVFFGLISYSLYLFHYPIFAFARVLEIFNDYHKFLFIFLTIIVSIFSFYYIEKPFRNKKIISFKKLIIILPIFIVFLTTFNFYVIKKNGIETRLPKIMYENLREPNVKFYQRERLQKIVLIGDSHSGSLEYHLNEEIKKNDFSLFRFETDFYLKDFKVIDIKTKQADKEFNKRNNRIDKFLDENSNLIVIFHQRWSIKLLETLYDNKEGYKEYKRKEEKYFNYYEPINIKTKSQKERVEYIKDNLISQINNIINRGHKLILIYPVPEMGFDPQKLLYSDFVKKLIISREKYLPEIFTGSYEVYKKRNRLIFEILDNIQSPNIYRVYPHKLFCEKQIENRCVANDENSLFYRDNNHLSLKGSKFVVDEIMNEINKIKFKSD